MEDEMRKTRDDIDAVDARLVALLAERFALTRRVGEWKARLGEQPLNPERQRERQALLTRLSVAHGVELALLQDIFAAIQRRTLQSHRRLAQDMDRAP